MILESIYEERTNKLRIMKVDQEEKGVKFMIPSTYMKMSSDKVPYKKHC